MKKLLLFVVVVAVVGLFAYAVHDYHQRPKQVPNTVTLEEHNAVIDTMELHDAVNTANLAESQAKLEAVTTQRNTLCTTYKTAKVVIPATLCQ